MLAEIHKDVPLDYTLPAVESAGPFMLQTDALVAYLERLEFRTLLKRVPGAKIASTPTLTSGASIVSDSKPDVDYSAVPDGSEDDNSAAAVPRDVTITDDISILASWAGKPVAVRVAAGPGASLDAAIYGICLADGSGTALRISAPLEEVVDTGLFGGSTAAAVIDPAVKAFLEDVNQPKSVHDARGTLVLLTRLGVKLGGLAFDAELASYLLQAGRRSGYAVHDVAAFFGGI